MNNLATRVVEYMRSKRYLLFNGPQHVNIIYIEGLNANGTLNSDAPNCFNDRRLVLQTRDGIPQIIGNWEATTEPGSHYTYSPMNPLGAARIKFGQYTSWAVGLHGRDRHEALVQVANVSVHRDFNKDFLRTGDRITTGLYGINQHWGYDLGINNISTASAGCLVGRSRGGHREFMNFVKSDVRYKKDPSFIFTTTIIPGDDLAKLFPGDSL
ncbi:MAG: hypothetical protein KME01_14465 [Chroococcus sp. CMT-3BRIN-NPC107]|jgi:hypothetical protein|nr:hypothetical protein [Chroococcus sp. CMT-3BRIN-NPC107]